MAVIDSTVPNIKSEGLKNKLDKERLLRKHR